MRFTPTIPSVLNGNLARPKGYQLNSTGNRSWRGSLSRGETVHWVRRNAQSSWLIRNWRMELGFVKLCCAAVVQVSSAKASPGNRASKRSAGDLIGTLPVKATAALGLTRD
jgi:hypothetical protein